MNPGREVSTGVEARGGGVTFFEGGEDLEKVKSWMWMLEKVVPCNFVMRKEWSDFSGGCEECVVFYIQIIVKWKMLEKNN